MGTTSQAAADVFDGLRASKQRRASWQSLERGTHAHRPGTRLQKFDAFARTARSVHRQARCSLLLQTCTAIPARPLEARPARKCTRIEGAYVVYEGHYSYQECDRPQECACHEGKPDPEPFLLQPHPAAVAGQ